MRRVIELYIGWKRLVVNQIYLGKIMQEILIHVIHTPLYVIEIDRDGPSRIFTICRQSKLRNTFVIQEQFHF